MVGEKHDKRLDRADGTAAGDEISKADEEDKGAPGGLEAASEHHMSRFHEYVVADEWSKDPLVAKHRSKFDKDFRTVDYANLSGDAGAPPRRKRRQHSSWHAAPEDAEVKSSGAYNAKFAFFGGSVIPADFVRMGEGASVGGSGSPRGSAMGGASAGNPAGPAKPEALPLAAPDPDGRTPIGKARARAGQDPLVAKYRSEAASHDFRTVNYSDLRSHGEPNETKR